MELAPIVLFVYNRPSHTLQTLQALSKNDLADKSVLYIYSDGPKHNAPNIELDQIKEVRKIIKSERWCKQVFITERKTNLGLDESVIEGVSKLISKNGNIIVLEDDIVTSFGFLRFMNDNLRLYESTDEVMHISGYCLPVKWSKQETVLLKGGTSSWGWATWDRAWKKFNPNGQELYQSILQLNTKYINQFNFEGGYNYLEFIKSNAEGKNNCWDIRWYASVFLENGFGVWPTKSFVQNIGHDGTGSHKVNSQTYDVTETSTYFVSQKLQIKDSIAFRKKIIAFYKATNNGSLISKIKAYLKKSYPK